MSLQTELMISVMNGEEALAALEGGADIIDIKNPAEGALGAPAPATIQEVRLRLQEKKPYSVALGEFPGKPGAAALAALGSAHFQPAFIKIAFIPHTCPDDIIETLQAIKKSLSLETKKLISLVSVTYADTLRYASWDLDDFTAISKEGGADGCLIDTWEKKNKSLLNYVSLEKIAQFIESCHRLQLFCGLAGSLTLSDIKELSQMEADIIGVRSAVCGGDRLRGTVSARAVKELKELIARKFS